MRKVLALILVFTVSLFAATSTPDSLTQKSIYIKEGVTYVPKKCEYKCEPVKDGYFSRVANVHVEKGLITCNIYSVKEPIKVLEQRAVFNEHCKKDYTFTPDKNVDKPDELKLRDRLKALEVKYFKNFISTGEVQYITAPEYLVAVLTADADIINVKETLEENRIILNPEYTIYPNEQKSYERSWLNSVESRTKSVINVVVNGFNSLFGIEKGVRYVTPPDKWSTELTSSTSQLISTIGVFWIDFLTESNSLYQETNFLIVMILFPFSAIVMTGESYTQKLSKVQGYNNWVGGGVVSAFVFLTMFLTYPVAKTGGEDIFGQPKNLDQSFYQDSTSYLLSHAVKIANSFNATFNKVYINQMARNASVNPNLSQGDRKQKLEHFKKVQGAYDSYLNICFKSYDNTALFRVSSRLYDIPLYYPPNESYGGINFYNFLLNKDNLIKNNFYSIDSCYEMNRKKKLLAIRMEALEKEIKYGQIAIEKGMEDRVLNIAEVGYKNTVEMGFLSALTTASMVSTLENLEEFQHYSDDIEEKRAYIEKETQQNLYNQNAGMADMLEHDWIAMFPKSLPYYGMPFFAAINNGVFDLLSFGGAVSKNEIRKRGKRYNETKEANKGRYAIDDKTQGIGDTIAHYVLKLARKHKAFAVLEALIKTGGHGIALAISIWVYEYFLALLVPFAILSAGLMVVLFWIAEVVIYYLVTPFLLAYAMLKSQGQAVSKFLARGLVIAARPTLIVFSIIVAILLHSLYEGVSIFIITKNFSALFGLNELGMINTFTGLMQQGFYEIALKLFIPFVMFFIILVGAIMFLKQFGWSDEADFGQQLTSSLEARGGRYNLPV